MSLDNIQLPAILLQQLFKDSLVELNGVQVNNEKAQHTFTYLGRYQKKILLVVTVKEAIYLQDEALAFVIKLLVACQCTMDDVAILNTEKNKEVTYTSINKNLQPNIVLLFDVSPDSIDMPLSFPYYQVQKYNSQVFLYCPSVLQLLQDVEQKKQLWACLQQIFFS
jgi:RNAse (barnase) inhibitor barstar